MKAKDMPNDGLSAHMQNMTKTRLFDSLPPKTQEIFKEAIKRIKAIDEDKRSEIKKDELDGLSELMINFVNVMGVRETNPTTIGMVAEFHQVFGHPISNRINVWDAELNKLRVELLREELEELEEALYGNDVISTFDALLDLQYVLDGAFLALGFAGIKDKGFAEVQRSNMSKLGEDGKPIYRDDGKILKGPNFSEPDLIKIIGEM